MKQTNNAIKFLMAQYRAIFRNANLKMFLAAATAAAALAAGSAQAATSFDKAKVEAADTALGAIIDGKGTDDGKYDKIEITQDTTSDKAYVIEVQSGAAANKIEGTVTLSKSSILVSGADKAQAQLAIGKADGSAVTLGSLAVSGKGQLTVGADSATAETTVTAETITLGGSAKAADDVSVTIKDQAKLISTGDLTIGTDAAVEIEKGGAAYGNTTNMNDGAVTLAGTLGEATKTLNLNKGTVTVATTADAAALAGSTIELKDGATVDTSGTLTIGKADGSFKMTGGTITNKTDTGHLKVESNANVTGGTLDIQSGDATFAGTASFGAESKISLGAGAKLVLTKDSTISSKAANVTSNATGKLEIKNTSATMSAETLKKFLVGEVHSTAGGNTATIKFSDAKVELDDLALQTKNGKLNANLKDNNDSFFAFEGEEASFKGAAVDANTTLTFNSMTLGKDGVLTLKEGADLFVGKSLAVNGDGAGIKVESGSIVLKGQEGSVTAKAINLEGADTDKAKLQVESGKWSVKDLTLTKGSALVDNQSTLTAVNVDLKEGTLEVKKGSTLNVIGNLTTAADKGKIAADASVINTVGGGTVSIGTAGVDLKNTASLKLESKDFEKDGEGKKIFDPSKLTGAITGTTNTTVTIMDGASKLSMTETEFDALQKALGADKFKGSIDVNVTGTIENAKDGMNLSDVKDGLGAEAYKNISAKQDAATAVSGNKTIGSVELTGTGNELKLDGTNGASLSLYTAKDGKFVYTKDEKGNTTAAGINFGGKENSLTLAGSGEIGAITNTHTANAGALTIGTAEKAGTVTVKGGIGAKEANKGVESVTVNANSHLNVEGGVYTDNLDMRQGTSLNAKDGAGEVVVSGTATILGSIDAGTLNLSGAATTKHSIAGDSVIDVTNLKLAGSNMLIVGTDGDENGKGSTTASVFADALTMGTGSSLFVDPHHSKAAAFVVVNDITNTAGTSGTVDGAIYVGQNAGLGYGFADEQDFMDVVGGYLNGHGAFGNGEKDVKNALVLNKPVSITATNGIVVDAGLKVSDMKDTLDTKYQNTLTLDAGSALVLTDEAFATGAAITFGKTGETVATAKVNNAAGSQVVLVGDYHNASSINLFQATGGTVTIQNKMDVSALGGLLSGTIAANTTTASGEAAKIVLAKHKDTDAMARAGVSAPVGQVFIDYIDHKLDVEDGSVGHGFLIDSMQSAEGRKQFDAAAHAATYAGAQQAAVAAVGTMAGAVGGRVGSMGVEATAITATGSQANGGVWLAPMYQSVDADGFNAEGASYGADVDLGGVAFGADTVNGNMRFGAVFNIGSGDADGKGNGAGLKDEFDYYGFGIYSVMGFGQLSIVGDASLSVISHEVEGLEAKGEADTTAVTMGVTGQYTISNPMVDVTPHLGARFIRLDTDSYDLTVGGKTLATTDFDVQNVFSIPLGVTLSKAFEMGGWSLAPSADLSITFNTGDTDAKSTTRFDGIQRDIGLSTEVLDEVTYGVAVGLGAQYGSFGTQIGINYTGSENTDSFGVNANARYMF